MENNQNPIPNGPKKKQLSPRDLALLALAIFAVTRINFSQMNSFHVLLLFLLFLMLMLRWANMRKAAVRRQAMERYKDEYETEAANAPVNKSAFQWEDAPAEKVSADEMTVDGDTVPAEPAEKSAE